MSKLRKYGRVFKSEEDVKAYVQGRVRSWSPIIRKMKDKKSKDFARGAQKFWKKELKRLK